MKKLFLAIALTMAAWGSYASTNDDLHGAMPRCIL